MKKNIFTQIQMKAPNSNRFDLTHDIKFSAKMGWLTPIMNLECVPGDKFDISSESLIRFSPLVSPVMHRLNATIHYFFVPHRLTWDNWEKFITNDASAPAFPYLNFSTLNPAYDGSLADYLGVPDIGNPSTSFKVSALPFAAYQMIFNEYYRDQNLIPEVNYKLVNGTNTLNLDLLAMRRRAWEHDYFTSALPTAQQGGAVNIPLGQVTLDPNWDSNPNKPKFLDGAGAHQGGDIRNSSTGMGGAQNIDSSGNPLVSVAYDPEGSLTVGSTTINDLRRAYRLQEWLEKTMRTGKRYIESILGHFGVTSSDKRLDRPEYITGTKTPVVISEVLNTTGETGGLPQGNMAGHAISVGGAKNGSYYCEEHGYIIGIMSVMPMTAYSQGIPRHFIKESPLDFYWPEFANLGEQEILNKELYVDHFAPDGTFGYIPRYAEYKYQSNRVAGQFRSSLDFWHMGRIFTQSPALNQAFIECDPTKRIFAVTNPNDDELYCTVLNKVWASRKMPFFGTPTI